eukprot:gnl/TRDRNA2_/TRDRNA2_182338_c0_seq1.p1 gnl/TRDRNA2_/TRDRNA2_182338_c0~~gnl/TRDRNA2_/TRDRNA2_182338_c0_seq1.p1  ORF type:complete len:427 (+),score=90.51 gnl/TRDRNA2_/TRDRNA2_182338_c0_seq1:71-1351(+)
MGLEIGTDHAYGTSLGCISRRLFILGACWVLGAVCWLRLGGWIVNSHVVDSVIGTKWAPQHNCVGLGCYDVWSCYGMKDSSQHMREPVYTLAGAFFFPAGAIGAHWGSRSQTQMLAMFLLASATAHVGLYVFDIVFYETCNMYPMNMFHQTLLWAIPVSPLSSHATKELRHMDIYPIKEVDILTNHFPSFTWYLCFAGAWIFIQFFIGFEARTLGLIMERGPLGLGVHYGIDQWDEVIDWDVLRRKRNTRSKFIEDCIIDEPNDVERPLGYGYDWSQGGYGATMDDEQEQDTDWEQDEAGWLSYRESYAKGEEEPDEKAQNIAAKADNEPFDKPANWPMLEKVESIAHGIQDRVDKMLGVDEIFEYGEEAEIEHSVNEADFEPMMSQQEQWQQEVQQPHHARMGMSWAGAAGTAHFGSMPRGYPTI